MKLHQLERVRARSKFLSSLWKISIGSIVLGGLFALTAAGGGFGGPTDGVPADGRKAMAVLMFTMTVAAFLIIVSTLRYWLTRKRVEHSSR